MRRRTFKADDVSGDRVLIRGDEAHHAMRVLRLDVGDELILIDGRGLRAVGRIERVGDGELSAVILSRSREASQSALTVATAIPKGERADWMVEKCAELGVAELIPLLCERSQVEPGGGKLSRWRRKSDEAAKQSGQSRSMVVTEPMALADALAACKTGSPKWYGAPGGQLTFAVALSDRVQSGAVLQSAMVLIGPEGGFSPAEVQALEQSGALPVSFGGTILRVETAAVAAAVVWGMASVG